MTKKLKVLDLFSGIGGFSLGLHRTGYFETIAFCEIDKDAQKVLKKNFPGVHIYEDVTKLDGTTLDLMHGQIDVICGGFPCQDISVAGHKKGFTNENGETTRSGLWCEYKRLIEEIKPKWVLIENVRNLLNLGLETVLKDLHDLGYNAEWEIISAASIGANHKRERLWIVAYPNGERGQQGMQDNGPRYKKELSEETRDTLAHEIANANLPRLWPTFTSEEKASGWWAKTASCFCDWWASKSLVYRVDDGLSSGLDESERFRKARVKQLGNAVVPFIPEIIGNRIKEIEQIEEIENF